MNKNGIVVCFNRKLGMVKGGVISAFQGLASALGSEYMGWMDVSRAYNINVAEPIYRYHILDRCALLSDYIDKVMKLRLPINYVVAEEGTMALTKEKIPLISTCQNTYGDIVDYFYPTHYGEYDKMEFGMVYTHLQEQQYKKSEKIVSVSKYAQDYAKRMGFDSEVINWGIDEVQFQPLDKLFYKVQLGLPISKKVAMCVTRQNAVKGYDTLRRLAKQFQNIHWVFVFADPVNVKHRLPNVTIVPPRDYQEMVKYYSAADFFVSASIIESFNLSWGESLMCNTPAICSATGYLWNHQEKMNDWGVCVKDAENYDDYADAVRYVVDNLDKFTPRKWILKEGLTLNNCIAKWKQLIEKM